MTGIYTGRSPKDKFFVKDETSANSMRWTSEEYKNDNKPITPEARKPSRQSPTRNFQTSLSML